MARTVIGFRKRMEEVAEDLDPETAAVMVEEAKKVENHFFDLVRVSEPPEPRYHSTAPPELSVVQGNGHATR
jgi:hypothetical protein